MGRKSREKWANRAEKYQPPTEDEMHQFFARFTEGIPANPAEADFVRDNQLLVQKNRGIVARQKTDGRLCIFWPDETGNFTFKFADGGPPAPF